jgi:hypothetical protein
VVVVKYNQNTHWAPSSPLHWLSLLKPSLLLGTKRTINDRININDPIHMFMIEQEAAPL